MGQTWLRCIDGYLRDSKDIVGADNILDLWRSGVISTRDCMNGIGCTAIYQTADNRGPGVAQKSDDLDSDF